MRNVILLSFLLLISCRSDGYKAKQLSKNEFAFEPGRYLLPNIDELQYLNIREFKDGGLTFCVVNNRNKPLYDYGSVMSFSNYQKWGIFVDENENLWFYNGDFQQRLILIRDTVSEGYTVREFPSDTVMPVKFKNWMDK
jgi:hypothetical protein